jgi:hypothetical protein
VKDAQNQKIASTWSVRHAAPCSKERLFSWEFGHYEIVFLTVCACRRVEVEVCQIDRPQRFVHS